MPFPSTQFDMPEGFKAEAVGERCWHVWRTDADPDGGIELVYHDVASGIMLLSIDLSCSALPTQCQPCLKMLGEVCAGLRSSFRYTLPRPKCGIGKEGA